MTTNCKIGVLPGTSLPQFEAIDNDHTPSWRTVKMPRDHARLALVAYPRGQVEVTVTEVGGGAIGSKQDTRRVSFITLDEEATEKLFQFLADWRKGRGKS